VQVATLTSGATAIAVGAFHTCAIVNGGAQCWGATNIAIPDGDYTAHRTTPVAVEGLTSGVTAIAAGGSITCAVVNGEARCLGSNGGAIGNGTTNWATAPVTVQGLTSGVTALSIGTVGGANHVCAMVNNRAECWGSNASGELGNASRTPSSVPVMVTDVPPPPPPCGECIIGAEHCDPTTFGPIFCVAGADGCGHWGPAPARNGCTGQARPGCEQTNSPFYCFWDAASCRVEARCPAGMICIAGTAGCVACPPGFPGCTPTP